MRLQFDKLYHYLGVRSRSPDDSQGRTEGGNGSKSGAGAMAGWCLSCNIPSKSPVKIEPLRVHGQLRPHTASAAVSPTWRNEIGHPTIPLQDGDNIHNSPPRERAKFVFRGGFRLPKGSRQEANNLSNFSMMPSVEHHQQRHRHP